MKIYRNALKRLLDIAAVLCSLPMTLPLILVVALLVRRKLGKPALFQQTRPGRGGGNFTIYKFRTMTDERDQKGNLLPDKDRLTKLGHFLRSTSLDELPELWNVLKGEMSLVGPRPLLPEYLDVYTEEEKRRHDVTPGITGWAQVNGRNQTPWDERLRQDVWYVDNLSFPLDIKILFLTFWKTIRREQVNESEDRTRTSLIEERQNSGGSTPSV